MTQATSFPKSQIQVVLVEGIHDRGRELFAGEGFSVRTLKHAPDHGELLSLAREAHILGVRSKSMVTREILESAPRLLAVGCYCIGTNQVDLNAAAMGGVPVFNAPFNNTRSVAELTIAEIIALNRQLFDRSAGLHRGVWDKSASGAHEVRGRTIGIVGYGHIGSQVSVLAEAMGMRVMYFDIESKLPLGNARPVRTLEELLSQADAVTLHVPATPGTKGLINAERLGLMKPDAVLINNARGSVVDVAALADALRNKRIAGAALDVFPHEPASKEERFESELQGLPNVILSPHIGGSTIEAQAGIAEDVSMKLMRFINVGSTTGAVNVPRVDLPEQASSEAAGDEGRRSHRILHFHRNEPGVLRTLHTVIAELGINITGEYLQTDARLGYVVLDVAPSDGHELNQRIRALPETIRTRVLW